MKPQKTNRYLSVICRNFLAPAILWTVAGVGAPAFAADLTWDANGAGADVTNGAGVWDKSNLNWWNGTDNVSWSDGNTAVIGANPLAGAGGTINFADGVDIAVAGLRIDDNGNATNHTLAPPAAGSMLLTVGAGGITANDGAVITQPFDFVANQTWQRSGTGNGALEIAGSTSDGGVDRDLVLASNLGVANLGIVLRSGAGHYGTTTLKDGFFRMRHSSLGGSTVILDAATGAQRIQFGNEAGTGGESGTFGNPVQLTADREGAFHIWTNFTTTLSQPVTGGNAASVFRKTDGGALVLAADNTYPGATIIDAGTLQLGEGGTTGSLDVSASLTINGSGVLSIRRSGSTNLSAIVPGAAGANYAPFTANDGRINFSGPTQTDTLVIDQDLGTANTFGQLRVSSGTMTLPSGTDLQLRSL